MSFVWREGVFPGYGAGPAIGLDHADTEDPLAKPRLNHERLTESGTFGYGNLIENLASRGNLKTAIPDTLALADLQIVLLSLNNIALPISGLGDPIEEEGGPGPRGSKDQGATSPSGEEPRSERSTPCGVASVAWDRCAGVERVRRSMATRVSCRGVMFEAGFEPDDRHGSGIHRPPVAPLPPGHGTDRNVSASKRPAPRIRPFPLVYCGRTPQPRPPARILPQGTRPGRRRHTASRSLAFTF